MGTAQKKVVVRMLGGALAWGYLPQSRFVAEGQVELMGVDGRVKLLPFNDIETIAYVKDFNVDDPIDPERMGRRAYAVRPKGDGLWVRLGFREVPALEGLVTFDMGLLEALVEDRGLFLTPPDARSNTVRVFVPREALRSVEVLGWVTAPSRRAKVERPREAGLFDDLAPGERE